MWGVIFWFRRSWNSLWPRRDRKTKWTWPKPINIDRANKPTSKWICCAKSALWPLATCLPVSPCYQGSVLYVSIRSSMELCLLTLNRVFAPLLALPRKCFFQYKFSKALYFFFRLKPPLLNPKGLVWCAWEFYVQCPPGRESKLHQAHSLPIGWAQELLV